MGFNGPVYYNGNNFIYNKSNLNKIVVCIRLLFYNINNRIIFL